MAEDGVNQLPPSIQGDGRKFISLLKNYLKNIASELDDQVKKVESYFNVLADNPDTIDEQVSGITISEKAVNGSVSLLIKWDSSDIKQYSGASIDVKVGDFHDTMEMFEDKEIVRHYDTARTNQFTLDNVEIGKKYWIRVRGKDAKNALSIDGKSPVVLHYIAETKYIPRPPYEATVVFDKRGAYWSWKQYPQNDYEWTELRLDEHVGELHNRLDLTTAWSSTAMPYARQGTGYLYNKGVGNSYSAPVKVEYSKGVPHAPKSIKVTPVFEGLYVEFDVIPDDCYGANVYINNEKHFVQDNKFSFNCSTGDYTVKVCFVDVFGEGEMSQSVQQSTIEEIPPDAVHITERTVFDNGVIVAKYIGDKAVVGTKIADGAITTDKLVANAITGDKISANAITTEKIATGAVETKHIKTNSIEGNVIKTGTLNGDAITANTISGDKISANTLTGDKIKAGTITGEKVATHSIQADKLQVDTLSALTARIGRLRTSDKGARTEISDNLIEVFDENNRLRVRIGRWG